MKFLRLYDNNPRLRLIIAFVQILLMPAYFYYEKRTIHSVFEGLFVLSLVAIGTVLSDLPQIWATMNLLFSISSRRPIGTVVLKGLFYFAWFFGEENRDNLQMIISDLKRDRKAMISSGFKPWLIRCILFWSSMRSIIPIVWHETMAVLGELAGAADLIRRIIGRK
jgi:hypothetical protein